MPVKVYVPQWTGPFPVVVLSHGAGGNWDANFAQARHLASHGYVVLAVEHMASNSERLRQGMRFAANLKGMTRDASEVLGRPRDVAFALDQAQKWNQSHAELKGVFDMTRVAAVGTVRCLHRAGGLWCRPRSTGSSRVEPGKGLGRSDDPCVSTAALSPWARASLFFLYGHHQPPVLGISGSRDEQQATLADRRRFFELGRGEPCVRVADAADHQAFSTPPACDAQSAIANATCNRPRAAPLFLQARLAWRCDTCDCRNVTATMARVVNRVEVLRK